MHAYWATEVTFVLGCLLRQDVTLEGLTAFNGTTRTNTEALFGAAFGLHFGHLTAPYFVLVRRLQTPCSLVGPEPLLISHSLSCLTVRGFFKPHFLELPKELFKLTLKLPERLRWLTYQPVFFDLAQSS
jgi:hypothetical protein